MPNNLELIAFIINTIRHHGINTEGPEYRLMQQAEHIANTLIAYETASYRMRPLNNIGGYHIAFGDYPNQFKAEMDEYLAWHKLRQDELNEVHDDYDYAKDDMNYDAAKGN